MPIRTPALLVQTAGAPFQRGMVERRDRTVGRLGVDSILALLTYGAGLVVLYGLR